MTTYGYYSTIKLVPDLDRDESINLGVMVYCRDPLYLDFQTVLDDERVDPTTISRLRRFYPSIDPAFLLGRVEGLRNTLLN